MATKRKPLIEYHPSTSDPAVWNLRVRGANGEVMLQGTQGYTESNAKRAATRLPIVIGAAEIAKGDR